MSRSTWTTLESIRDALAILCPLVLLWVFVAIWVRGPDHDPAQEPSPAAQEEIGTLSEPSPLYPRAPHTAQYSASQEIEGSAYAERTIPAHEPLTWLEADASGLVLESPAPAFDTYAPTYDTWLAWVQVVVRAEEDDLVVDHEAWLTYDAVLWARFQADAHAAVARNTMLPMRRRVELLAPSRILTERALAAGSISIVERPPK